MTNDPRAKYKVCGIALRLRVAKSACLSLVLVLTSATATRAQSIFERKLTASDASPSASFGISVGISGNTAVVGARAAHSAAFNEGSAYLFDANTGTELFKLAAADLLRGDGFGASAAISGDTAIVGAPERPNDPGSAYLFDVTTGQERFKLTPSDGLLVKEFGSSVGISGNTAIVGSTDDDDDNEFFAAYLFDVTTGQERFRLFPDDDVPLSNFGYSVAISGETAIVGARDGDVSRSGAAYLFDVQTGRQLFKLTPSDGRANDIFGDAVAISGNTAIIGAALHGEAGNETGAAYLFDVTTGEQLFKLTASDGAQGDNFGWSVAIDGNTALVGALGHDDEGSFSGSAYLFDVITGEELLKLTASDAAEGDYFGTVGISGSVSIVGAYRDDDAGTGSGSAYLFVSIPEPSSLLLAIVALLSLLMIRRPPACRGA
ncbi:MAG: FG-GAP repeat protein [Planctomycetes bacterium]|nr:FG-GAP repeat protein [Planctomycetota bacterium]